MPTRLQVALADPAQPVRAPHAGSRCRFDERLMSRHQFEKLRENRNVGYGLNILVCD